MISMTTPITNQPPSSQQYIATNTTLEVKSAAGDCLGNSCCGALIGVFFCSVFSGNLLPNILAGAVAGCCATGTTKQTVKTIYERTTNAISGPYGSQENPEPAQV